MISTAGTSWVDQSGRMKEGPDRLFAGLYEGMILTIVVVARNGVMRIDRQ